MEEQPGNPQYPDLKIPAVVKAGPRKVYGEMVLKRINELNVKALVRRPAPRHPSESGTPHSDPEKILEAIRTQAAAKVRTPMPPATRYVGESRLDHLYRLYVLGRLGELYRSQGYRGHRLDDEVRDAIDQLKKGKRI